MDWLHREGFTVIALRDLARYLDPARVPADPLGAINARLRALGRDPVTFPAPAAR
jgi:hypothetical protein